MAMNESPQIWNIMKYKTIKKSNINHLKQNLGKQFSKGKKRIITDKKNENVGLSKSTSKDIIERMNEVLERYDQGTPHEYVRVHCKKCGTNFTAH